MAERNNEYTSSRFIFELTIHKLSLGVDRPIDVDLLWVAGSQRSQTGERISILPNTFSHKVNQKLIIHHTFLEDHIKSCKSTFQVLESQRYVQPTVLGTCEIDLASLIFEKHTRAVTVPLKTKLDDNASVSFSVKVTNLVLGADSVVSSSMSSVSDRMAEYQDVMTNTSLGNSTKTHVLHGMNSDDIYKTINKMATKLSHIEREIQAKSMKLNKINRNNLDEINGIRSRLEDQISQKDRQIQILSVQLDEMHTALALSHQRELELGGYNLSSMQLHNNTHLLDNQEDVGSEAACGLNFGRLSSHINASDGRGYISSSFAPERSGRAFDNRVITNDYDFRHHQTTSSSVVDNFVPRAMDHSRGSGCVVHRNLPTASTVVKARMLNGSSVNFNKYVSRKGAPKLASPLNDMLGHSDFPGLRSSKGRGSSHEMHSRPIKPQLPVVNKHHYVLPTMASDKMISVGEYPFVGCSEAARLLNSPRRVAGSHGSPRQLPHEARRALRTLKTSSGNQLRTPGTTMLNTGASPQLAQRAQKAQAHTALNKVSNHLMSRAGAFVDHADIAATGNSRLLKSPSSMYSAYDHDAEVRIVSLERDLITTKVALADSETQRDIDITRLIKMTTKQ